jgi:hypothetical protein
MRARPLEDEGGSGPEAEGEEIEIVENAIAPRRFAPTLESDGAKQCKRGGPGREERQRIAKRAPRLLPARPSRIFHT